MLDNVRRTTLKERKARRMFPSYNGVSCGWLSEGRFCSAVRIRNWKRIDFPMIESSF
jgi:hypothetical protein